MIKKAIIYGILFFIAIIMIFPMAWMLILSLKSQAESISSIQSLISTPFTLVNYTEALNSDNFILYFFNSVLVSSLVTIANLLFCFLVAYGLVRKNTKINKFVYISILGVLIIPAYVIMIPLYRIIAELNWMNSYAALIVPWVITPFGIFLVRQFLLKIPKDIEDAAMIDGAGQWYIVFRIVMPLCKPVLTVLAIYTFLSNWNSFLFPFIFTNDQAHRTLPIGLAFYIGKQSIDWGHLMAGASISALPIILIFSIFQKQIIEGLTAGGLKE